MAAGELLERAPALAVLAAAAAEVRRGEGVVVLIGGEAGVGKTALVRRFADDMTGRMRIFRGGCDALSTPRPLAPLVDMAADLGAAFRAELAGAARRDVLFEAFLAALRTGVAPALVVLEDLHWADDATLDLVRYLGRRVASTRSLVVATYRDDEADARHPLRIALGDIASAAPLRRLRLEPLSLAAVRQLATASGLDPLAVHEATGGNPFFVSEILAHGEATLPPSVQDAVLARASRLPERARNALEVASVLGVEASAARLEAVGASREGLATCVERGMLGLHAHRVAFRHQLLRDAVYASLTALRRRTLHAAALAALERETPPADPADLVHHAVEAGDGEAVLRLAPRAGRRAAALGAHREAYAQFQRALPLRQRLPPRERVALLDAFAVECGVLDALSEASSALLEACELYRALADLEALGVALARLASIYAGLARNQDADAAIAEALAVLPPLPARPARARAQWYQAHLAMLDRRVDEAVVLGRAALAIAEAADEPRVSALSLGTIGAALLMAERPGARETLERSAELGALHGFHEVVVNALANLGTGLGELHAFEEAEEALRRAIDYGERHEIDGNVVYARAWLAIVRMYRGAYDEAVDLAQRVHRRTPRSISGIMALVALGRTAARRGDPGAWALLDEALDVAAGTRTVQRVAPVRAARAEALALAGRHAEIVDEVAEVYELALARRHRWFAGELGYWLGVGGREVVLPPFAAAPFALEHLGRPDEAAAAWEALLCPYEAARARLGGGDEPALRQAHAALVALGAQPAAAVAARQLRALGARGVPRGPRGPTASHPAGLTQREAEVLRGLVEGLQNAEIALRHGVSRRTVDHQVSSLLAKLGVRSRAEAVASARRRDLIDPGA
jgi:DNA-binding CsgD family transcriptional regulator/tetratricopeptide (TPR) repeat protein